MKYLLPILLIVSCSVFGQDPPSYIKVFRATPGAKFDTVKCLVMVFNDLEFNTNYRPEFRGFLYLKKAYVVMCKDPNDKCDVLFLDERRKWTIDMFRVWKPEGGDYQYMIYKW